MMVCFSVKKILWSLIPLPTATPAGNIAETKSKNSIVKTVGKTLQMTSFATYAYNLEGDIGHSLFWHGVTEENFATGWHKRVAFRDFWAPKITFGITAIVLFAPLIIEGLKMVAQKYELSYVKSFFDQVDRVFMTAIKIINLALVTIGLCMAVGSGGPLLAGIYFSFFVLNFYPLFTQIQNKFIQWTKAQIAQDN